jgi:hypothetical protein
VAAPQVRDSGSDLVDPLSAPQVGQKSVEVPFALPSNSRTSAGSSTTYHWPVASLKSRRSCPARAGSLAETSVRASSGSPKRRGPTGIEGVPLWPG